MLHLDLTDPYWKMYTIVDSTGRDSGPTFSTLRVASLNFFRTFPQGEAGDRTIWNHPITLTAVAFVTTAIPSFLLVKTIGKHLESITVMAWALLVGGVAMWAIDWWSDRRDSPTKDVEQMSLWQAIWIGGFQILSAVFPGTSRSMSTISSGQLAGLTRGASLEFSFLVSIPIMVVATGYDLIKSIHPKQLAGESAIAPLVITSHGWIVLAIGLVVSFLVALGVVEWFLIWVRKHGFMPFAIYRIILGIVLLRYGAQIFGS